MSDRLLPASQIPTSLWNPAQGLLRLPESLSTIYATEIEARNLIELALKFEPEQSPIGGISLADTELHFATRFSGSSGRAALPILDPKDELGPASDRIIGALAGGKVAILDIPCGTGAGSAALLTTLASLREQDCIPCHPLQIRLLGGDKSEHALKVASSVWSRLVPVLMAQGIELSHETLEWDVKDAESTTTLISAWVNAGRDARIHFILASNFSGFLGNKGNLKDSEAQLGEIFRWAGTKAAQIVWIEPQTTIAESFLVRLLEKAKAKLTRLFSILSSNPAKPHAKTECRQQNPLAGHKTFVVRLSLMMLDHRDQVP